MAITTPAYITKHGLIAVHGVSSGAPTNFTAITTDPQFFLNGSVTPLTIGQGPIWPNFSHNLSWAFYAPATPLSNTDTLTMTAGTGWATFVAGAAPAVNLQGVANYIGQYEPLLSSWPTIPMTAFNAPPSSKTMRLGYNMSHAARALYFSIYSPLANLFYRGDNVALGANATYDANGYPLTLTATATWNSIQQTNPSGAIDNRGTPIAMGVYTVIFDEATDNGIGTGNPIVITMPPIANCTVTPVASVGGVVGLVNAGTLSGGKLVGRTWQWNVAYTLPNPASFTTNISLRFTGTGAGGSGAFTLSNPFFGGPGDSIRPTNKWAMSTLTKAWMTTPSGKTPDFLRWVDSTTGIAINSNIVDPGDRPNDNAWGYGYRGITSVNISSINTFDPATSPNIWWSQNWPNSTTPGGGPSGLPYATPTTAALLGGFGGASRYIFECVTSTPHGLKSGQVVFFQNTANLSGIPCTNGNLPNITVSLANFNVIVFVTSVTKFVAVSFSNASTNTTGQPGNINNVIGINPIASSTISVTVPDFANLPHGAVASMTGSLPNTNLWLNLPPAGTDATHAAMCADVFANFSSGRTIMPELGDELWNTNYSGPWIMACLGTSGALDVLANNSTKAAVLRQAQMQATVSAAAATAGWTGTILRCFCSQYGNPGVTTAIVNFINAWNAANPSNLIIMDGIIIADYVISPPSSLNDTTVLLACASVYGSDSRSKAFGLGLTNLTRAQWWDYYRHNTKFNSSDNGPTGIYSSHATALNTYVPVGGQPPGFVPVIYGYEGGIQSLTPSGGISDTPAMIYQLTDDLFYDQAEAGAELAIWQRMQDNGIVSTCKYSSCMPRTQATNTVFCWGQYLWAGQTSGPGTTNVFWVDTGQSNDYVNESVAADSWRAWVDSANAQGNFVLTESSNRILLEDGTSSLLTELTSTALTASGAIIFNPAIIVGAGTSATSTVVKFENWDQVVAPATPAGWNFGTSQNHLATRATGTTPTPLSSPNCIFRDTLFGIPNAIATYQTPDSAGGNVSVQGTGSIGSVAGQSNGAFFVVARGSGGPSAFLEYGSSTFYEGRFDLLTGGSGSLKINAVVSGTVTTLATVNIPPSTVSSGVWYRITLTCNGTVMSASFQRIPDGFWLNSSGTFQALSATAITVSDSSISGSGRAGWGANTPNAQFVVYGDDWTFTGASVVVPPIVVNGIDSGFTRDPSIGMSKWSDQSFERDSSFIMSSFWSLDSRLSSEASLASLKSTEFPRGIEQVLSRFAFGDSNFDDEKAEVFFTDAIVASADIFDHAIGCDGSLRRPIGSESGAFNEQAESVMTSTTAFFVDSGQGYDAYLKRTIGLDENVDLSREEFFTNVIIVGGVTQGAMDSATARDKQFVTASVFSVDQIGILDEGTADETQTTVIIVVGYFVYSNTGVGDPIDYVTPVSQLNGFENTTFTTDVLGYPGDWKFAVRAFNQYGIEGNLNCEVDIILDANGNDITNMPSAPIGLRATAIRGGDIRVEWTTLPPSRPAKSPTGFHVYDGVGSISYSASVATVAGTASFMASFQATLTGLVDGTEYIIGVRAFNATSEETNTVTVTCVSDATGPDPVINLTGSTTSTS